MSTKTQPIKGPVDFAIVTALRIERDAVLRRISDIRRVQEDTEPLTFYHGQIMIPVSSERYTVVVIMLLGMGNDEAAIATTRVIQRWQPANVLMVGIAGGVPGKVGLGDVVVAESSYYYELAKRTPKGEQRRPQHFMCDRLLYGRALAYEAAEWKGDIGVARPGITAEETFSPDVCFGVIASGEKVIADKKTVPRLLKEDPKIVAVAMEGTGMGRAALNNSPQPGFLEVRGICDFADEHKNDDWQSFAADAAAAFTAGLLRSRPIAPLQAKVQEGSRDASPLLILRAESLRSVAADEVLAAFGDDLKGRDMETVALDFTDLVTGDVIADPEAAAQRLSDPQGTLFGALSRRSDAEFVFHGLAHIPLLVLAGHLVTDRQRVRLFDFHPEAGTWAWQDDASDLPALATHGVPRRNINRAGDAIVRMAISYPVNAVTARAVVPRPLLEIGLALPTPTRSIVHSEEQTRAYGRDFRRVMDAIARHAPACRRVHLFYAGPVSLAFHIGQQVSANIHPAVTVWNFRRGAYEWGIDLAAASVGEPCIVRPENLLDAA